MRTGRHGLIGLLAMAACAMVQQAHGHSPEAAQVPAFVDAARRADLRNAWEAARTGSAAATTRERAEALSNRFAAEPSAAPEQKPATKPEAAPDPVAVEAASIESVEAPQAPSATEEQKPPVVRSAKTAGGKSKSASRRPSIQRSAEKPTPQRSVRVATYKQRMPEPNSSLGPAGRMSTDYTNWNAFPER